MKITEFSSELLRERYVRIDHKSGLQIYVFPKKLTTAYAIFATRYGSLNNAFRLAGDAEVKCVPDGIAHFLEHKLFENEDGSDAFERFAELGADANAYTSYERTAYLFSCTEHFEQSLEELLRFVTSPHFTPESVEKEQGIIGQEIREYEDNPWERCFQNLAEAMYREHPIRKNICGTEESIAQITDVLLYDCYRVFYRLSNMVLVVCGDVTPEQVCMVADRVLPAETAEGEIERIFPDEPSGVMRAYTEALMPVSKPIFSIGIKDPEVPNDPGERFRRDAALALLDDILFSRAGDFYNALFEEGVITPSFVAGYSCAEGFGFHCISGESDTPQLVLEHLKEYLKQMAQKGIPDEDFERCRRVMYADEMRAYDSTEEIAGRMVSCIFEGVEIFSYLPLLQSIEKKVLETLLEQMICEDRFALSVIRPIAEEERMAEHEGID